MVRTALFFMIVLAGCSAVQQTETPLERPELIKSAPLPPVSSIVPGGGMKFEVSILVLKDGSVGDVRLLESGGDPDWDTLALRTIMKWQFIPARRAGRPADLWIHQPLLVQLRDPVTRNLAELVCDTERAADSLYSLIENGEDFDTLLRQAAQTRGDLSGSLGAVDISGYAPHLKGRLLKLKEGEVSRPLRLGNRFVIYKRLKKESA